MFCYRKRQTKQQRQFPVFLKQLKLTSNFSISAKKPRNIIEGGRHTERALVVSLRYVTRKGNETHWNQLPQNPEIHTCLPFPFLQTGNLESQSNTNGKDAPSRTIATGVVNNLSSQTACQVVTQCNCWSHHPGPIYSENNLEFCLRLCHTRVLVGWAAPSKLLDGRPLQSWERKSGARILKHVDASWQSPLQP